jgi:hypothetical protein
MSEIQSSPSNIATISELLALSDSQYRIYDLGRRVDKVSQEQFNQIELNQLPYPYPSQGHAFIAIAFWQKQLMQPFLWFVKIPLDECGLLNQAARDHFVAIIIEALGANIMVDPSEKQEQLLKNNPYHFTPSQYKLAALNSKVKLELKQPSSEYLSLFLRYITGNLTWEHWQNIGVQGISDFAVRINEVGNTELLVKALPHLATEVLLPLCSALENEQLTDKLINSIIKAYFKSKDKDNSIEIQQHLLRALSSSCHHPYAIDFFSELLKNDDLSADILIILSGRCWFLWQKPEMLMNYLEYLVQMKDQPLFSSIFKDLVGIPTIRPNVFICMRNPKRSNELAQAIGLLLTKNN